MTIAGLRRLLLPLFTLIAFAPAQGRAQVDDTRLAEGTVAVLQLVVKLPPGAPEASAAPYFEDVIRSAVKRELPMARVVTRESVEVIAKEMGVDLSKCGDGGCEVETGRSIGADLIVTGELVQVGTQLKLSLRAHETRSAQLVRGTLAAGRSVEELDQALAAAVVDLLSPISGRSTAAVAAQAQALPTATGADAGFLTVLSQPRAKVMLDSFLAGTTPIRKLQVEPGAHILVLTAPGFESVRRDITVETGKELTVTETLKGATGAADLAASAPAAKLFLDGAPLPVGVHPSIPIGDHVLRAEADGFQPGEKPFTVEKGKTARVKVELKPLPGRLVLSVDGGAQCEVDAGRSQPVEDGKLLEQELAPGLHTILCRKEGYETFKGSVEIASRQDARVRAVMPNVAARSRGMKLGIALGAAAVAGLGAGTWGYLEARSIRDELKAEQPPYDPVAREDKIAKGDQANLIGTFGMTVGGVAAVLSGYFLVFSF